jgi:hypothetical protein
MEWASLLWADRKKTRINLKYLMLELDEESELEGSDPASLPSAGNHLFRMIRLGLNLKNCTVCLYLLHLNLSVIFLSSCVSGEIRTPDLRITS